MLVNKDREGHIRYDTLLWSALKKKRGPYLKEIVFILYADNEDPDQTARISTPIVRQYNLQIPTSL